MGITKLPCISKRYMARTHAKSHAKGHSPLIDKNILKNSMLHVDGFQVV